MGCKITLIGGPYDGWATPCHPFRDGSWEVGDVKSCPWYIFDYPYIEKLKTRRLEDDDDGNYRLLFLERQGSYPANRFPPLSDQSDPPANRIARARSD